MKKRIGLAIASVLGLTLITLSVLVPSLAVYNDVTFESYINMAPDSAIPSLFRNDSVMTDYRQHPPVISDGIEYVPLELFYGLSGVKISFSEDGSNFYIQNKNTNKYISFSISGEYAVTGSGNVYETRVHTFHDVYYVPLRTVCNATGIGCDSYNDGINKIYVIKVYTAKGLSAKELIRIHAPGIYGTASDEGKDTPPPPPEKTEKPPEDIFPPRTIYLFFDGKGFENASLTLDTLRVNGVRATFFVRREDILKYPDTVRRIYTEGHTLGITFSEGAAEISRENVLESLVTEALDNLYEVAKTKTRLLLLPKDSEGVYESSGVAERIENLGMRSVSIRLDARTDNVSAATAVSNLTETIKNLERTHRTREAFVRLTHTAQGRGAIAGLVSLANQNPAVHVSLYGEATE